MKPTSPSILTINGGSSSIKFALFEANSPLNRILGGSMEQIGLPEPPSCERDRARRITFRDLLAQNHTAAVDILMDWIEERFGKDALTAVGHRMVHGGKIYKPQRITEEMVEELRQLQSFRS